MTIIYVLLMVWSTATHHGGIGVVQQEFNSLEACEAARVALEKAHTAPHRVLGAQGCFKK